MKKIMLYFSAIVMMVLLFNCGDNQPSDETAVKKGRVIFGHSFARGLTKTTEGLSPGYIMFAPTNSPYTYLVNRKGEVVHEWKGTYGAFNPYLMDDGSVVVGEDDPDYPVFGFGGPMAGSRKLAGMGKFCGILNMQMKKRLYITILR